MRICYRFIILTSFLLLCPIFSFAFNNGVTSLSYEDENTIIINQGANSHRFTNVQETLWFNDDFYFRSNFDIYRWTEKIVPNGFGLTSYGKLYFLEQLGSDSPEWVGTNLVVIDKSNNMKKYNINKEGEDFINTERLAILNGSIFVEDSYYGYCKMTPEGLITECIQLREKY